jgi:aspartate oxidase
MWDEVSIVRRDRGLINARETIAELISEAGDGEQFYVAGAETSNLLECANLIVEAAIARRTNVGLHFNADLAQNPEEDDKRQLSQA